MTAPLGIKRWHGQTRHQQCSHGARCARSPSALSTVTRLSRKALTRVTLGSRMACSGAIHGSLPCPSCSPRLPMLCSACPAWERAQAAVPPLVWGLQGGATPGLLLP